VKKEPFRYSVILFCQKLCRILLKMLLI